MCVWGGRPWEQFAGLCSGTPDDQSPLGHRAPRRARAPLSIGDRGAIDASLADPPGKHVGLARGTRGRACTSR